MGILKWLRSAFSSDWLDAGFMVRDGHELHWPLGATIDVGLVGDIEADELYMPLLFDACEAYNKAIGSRVFLFPVMAGEDMVRGFMDPKLRPHLRNTVLVQVGERDPYHGDTDFRYDRRNGLILNALVTLPRAVHDTETWKRITRHEFGHLMGLEHDRVTTSIMYPRTTGKGSEQQLSNADVIRLRSRYGVYGK